MMEGEGGRRDLLRPRDTPFRVVRDIGVANEILLPEILFSSRSEFLISDRIRITRNVAQRYKSV